MAYNISVGGEIKGSSSHQSSVEREIAKELDEFVKKVHSLGADVGGAAFRGLHGAHAPELPPEHPDPGPLYGAAHQ